MFRKTKKAVYRTDNRLKKLPVTASLSVWLILSAYQANSYAHSFLLSSGEEYESYIIDTKKVQSKIIGSVKDDNGIPIIGATIINKSENITVRTNNNGEFEISAQRGNILSISNVGFTIQEITISDINQFYNIVLRAEDTSLEEVVVVGYGSQKKINLTGAVSVVKGEDLARQPVGQTSAALQGAAPGLTVTQSSGQPGRDNGGLKIRGIGTLGNANPLVLIDGIEGNINNVNSNDIASISVLKDASSAAIYGSRAANGVILITTKRGSEGGFSVNYNNYGGWQTPTDMTEMANGLDHMVLMNEAYTNTGKSPVFTEQMIEDYIAGVSTDSDRYPNTDWKKLTMKNNGFMQQHYLNISGGSDRVRVASSIGVFDQKGIIENTSFRRYNFRLNSDMNISEKLSSSIDLAFAKSELVEPSSGTTTIFHYIRRIPANQAGLLSNGTYGEGWNGNNPLAMARDGGLNQENPLDLMFNMDLKYKPFEGFTAQLVYSPKFLLNNRSTFINSIQTYYADGSKAYLTPQRNSMTERFDQTWYNNIRAVFSYDKLISDTHQITVLGGYQQEDQNDNYLNAYREMFLLPEFREINAGGNENQQNGGTSSQWALRSVFGRINYAFLGKYLFEANARYDGSSRFAKENQYSFFPSLSAGWRITEESFMQPLKSVITEAKVRASWGKLGNQNIGLYPFSAFVTLGGSNYNFGNSIFTGAALNSMANSEIRWETSEVTDIGLDLTLWNNLNISADYYYRKTDGILLQLDIPKILGLAAPYQNAGIVENKGWDFTANYRNSIGEFKYNLAVNLSDVRNKVLDMKGVLRTGLTVNHEGHPIGSLYGYEAIGYFQSVDEVTNSPNQFGTVAPGDIKYKDQNNDGVINQEDEIILGSPIPRYSYSANIGGAYKNFDFSLFLQGVGKADGYIYAQGIMPFYQGGTIQEQHKDRWTPTNPNAAFPRLAFNEANNIQNSSFWMKNASYLRLKNVSIGYTIPTLNIGNARVESIRIFATGQNIFTSTNFWKGFDPEGPISTGGWYPQMKVYSIGLNVKF